MKNKQTEISKKSFSKRIKKSLYLDNLQLSLFDKTLLFAPIFIWFSYYPIISFGNDSTMNFELSLTLIYVVILAILAILEIIKQYKKLLKNRAVLLVGFFIFWQFLTLFWTANLTRGILTFGIWFLLFLIFCTCQIRRENLRKIWPAFLKILVFSSLIAGILALIQIIAGIWLARNETLLCAGCVAEQFGFVRPNVFAIEPQFLGNILLAPSLILLQIFLSKNKILAQKVFARNSFKKIIFSIFFLITILILTLSRGAIFAFIGGFFVLFLLNIHRAKLVFCSIFLSFLSLVFALLIQVFVVNINPNYHEKFSATIARSVNQLSLGIIDLREKNTTNLTENLDNVSAEKTNENSSTNSNKTNKKPENNKPEFDGYVAESTDVRLKLSEIALQTWAENSANVWLGVGIGGAGVAMVERSENGDARQIVQNEFVEILLERGLIGAMIFVSILIGFFVTTRRAKWSWAIIFAFIIQWNFFSGLPNALHIYLILIVIFAKINSDNSTHKNLKLN